MGQSASDVRAGGAWYELYGVDKLSPVLKRAQKFAAQFGSFLSKVANRAAVVGGAITAPFAALFKGGTDRAADLARLSLQLGVPIEVLNKLQYAADAAGVSLDEVMSDWQGRYSSLIARAPGIDPQAARDAAKAQLEMSDATRSLQLALLPLVKTVTLYVTQLSKWVQNNAQAARTILLVGAGVVAFAVLLKLLAGAFSLVAAIAPVAWATALGPIGIGLAAGAILGSGLFLGIAYLIDEFALLKSTARELGNVLGTAFGGIADALGKADLELAGKIAIQGLKVLWLELVDSMTTVWVGFKDMFVDGWHEAVLGAELVLNNLATIVASVFVRISGAIAEAFKSITVTILDAAIRVAETMDRLDPLDTLKDGIAAAKSLRDTVANSGGDTGDKIAALEQMRQEKEAALLDAEAKAAKARKEGRMADVLAAQKELADAKAELARLRAQAAMPGAEPPNAFDQQTSLKQGLAGAVAAKGTFSSSALGQSLGVSDQAQKQTELLKLLADGKGGLPKEIAKQLAPFVAGMKITG